MSRSYQDEKLYQEIEIDPVTGESEAYLVDEDGNRVDFGTEQISTVEMQDKNKKNNNTWTPDDPNNSEISEENRKIMNRAHEERVKKNKKSTVDEECPFSEDSETMERMKQEAIAYNKSLKLNTELNEVLVRNNTDEIKKFIESNEIELKGNTKQGQMVLCVSATKGNVEIVKWALNKGADPDSDIEHNRTALHWAVGTDNLDTAKCLLDAGADKNKCTSEDGNSVLHTACARSSNVEIIKMLIFGETNFNTTNSKGETPLDITFSSFSSKKKDIARLLIDAGADVNGNSNEDNFITAPIFGAMALGDMEIVKCMIEKGVKLNKKNIHGDEPLIWINTDKSGESVLNLVKLCEDNGADILCTSDIGWNLAHKMAMINDVSTMKYLKEKGVDLCLRDTKGFTPQHFAANFHSLDVIKYFVEIYGDSVLDVKSDEGYTPLYLAENAEDKGKVVRKQEAIVYIKSIVKSDTETETNTGSTPVPESEISVEENDIQLEIEERA